jgi:hemolysin III
MYQDRNIQEENFEDIQEILEEHDLGLLPDGAGFYAETNPDYIIMEPYNAVSSLAFLIPVVYFMIKLRGRYRQFDFLTYCMPLLFLGGIGSTIFHALRSSPLFLLLDVLPIALLTLSVSIFFWIKILKQKWLVFIMVPAFVFMRFLVFSHYRTTLAINISYLITGLMIFVPGIIFLHKTKYQFADKLLWAVLLFLLALFFRRFDFEGMVLLPMGTHWLWHISCAAGAFMLGDYLYQLKSYQLKKINWKDQKLFKVKKNEIKIK